MIRVLQVDDHPALRAGMTAVLRSEPGLVPVGTATGEADLWTQLERTGPDVVVLDYHLPGTDGLRLCRRIKRRADPPAVLLLSAYAGPRLALAARLAGADGLIGKSAPADAIFDAIRTVARGDERFSPLTREVLDEAGRKLDGEDLPLLGMLLDGATTDEVAQALRLPSPEVEARIERVLLALQIELPISD